MQRERAILLAREAIQRRGKAPGNTTSASTRGGASASAAPDAFRSKTRERTGGPVSRVIATRRDPSGVHTRLATCSTSEKLAAVRGDGNSKMRRGGWLPS